MFSAFSSYAPPIITFQVIVNGQILFENTSRAMCNGYIFRNAIAGVRPTPLFDDED